MHLRLRSFYIPARGTEEYELPQFQYLKDCWRQLQHMSGCSKTAYAPGKRAAGLGTIPYEVWTGGDSSFVAGAVLDRHHGVSWAVDCWNKIIFLLTSLLDVPEPFGDDIPIEYQWLNEVAYNKSGGMHTLTAAEDYPSTLTGNTVQLDVIKIMKALQKGADMEAIDPTLCLEEVETELETLARTDVHAFNDFVSEHREAAMRYKEDQKGLENALAIW